MSQQLKILSHNVREIYEVVQTGENPADLLVPSLWEHDMLYNSSKGLGRIWKWFFQFFEIFLGPEFLEVRLYRAMSKTHQCFHENSMGLKEISQGYQEYLLDASKGKDFDQSKLADLRKGITDWNDSLRPFLKGINKNKETALKALTHLGFEYDPKKGGNPVPFALDSTLLQLKKCQKILDLEGIMGEPVPFSILEKLAVGAHIEEEESKQLAKWLSKVAKNGDRIGVRLFHHAFSGFIYLLKKYGKFEKDKEPNLLRLELALLNRGCHLFAQRDPKQILWRDSLKPGDVILCNGREITLAEQIGIKTGKEDNNRIFAIKGDASRVVSVGINEAVHGLKYYFSEKKAWGIEPAAYKEIESKGRFALIERLDLPLDSYRWSSPEGELIDEDFDVGDPLVDIDKDSKVKELLDNIDKDSDVADPLANLVRWFIQEKCTPVNFSSKYLMFSKEGVLKCLKVTLKQENNFDYCALEEFVHECADGNSKIFRYLMNKSTMVLHWYGKFFKKIVAKWEEGKPIDAAQEAGIVDKITEIKIVDRCTEMVAELSRMKAECMRIITEEYDGKLGEPLEQLVSRVIASWHYRWGVTGKIPPWLKDKVIAEIVRMDNLKLKQLR